MGGWIILNHHVVVIVYDRCGEHLGDHGLSAELHIRQYHVRYDYCQSRATIIVVHATVSELLVVVVSNTRREERAMPYIIHACVYRLFCDDRQFRQTGGGRGRVKYVYETW